MNDLLNFWPSGHLVGDDEYTFDEACARGSVDSSSEKEETKWWTADELYGEPPKPPKKEYLPEELFDI